jgi:hypothetical protein
MIHHVSKAMNTVELCEEKGFLRNLEEINENEEDIPEWVVIFKMMMIMKKNSL